MSIPWNAIAERSAGALPSVCADRVIVRRFDPASDSYAQLTPMLHRAFARLGAMGLNCTCVDQDEDVTRRRAQAGECYVAVCGGRVIGTATLYATDPSSACSLYRCEGVASVRQVAVDPDCQSRGIGACCCCRSPSSGPRCAAIRCSRSIRRIPLRICWRSTARGVSRSSTRCASPASATTARSSASGPSRASRAACRRRRGWLRARRPCGVSRMRCRRAWPRWPGATRMCAVSPDGQHGVRPAPRAAARRRGGRASMGASWADNGEPDCVARMPILGEARPTNSRDDRTRSRVAIVERSRHAR